MGDSHGYVRDRDGKLHYGRFEWPLMMRDQVEFDYLGVRTRGRVIEFDAMDVTILLEDGQEIILDINEVEAVD
jgi:hypothetical protein